jgi:hypothetical protein
MMPQVEKERFSIRDSKFSVRSNIRSCPGSCKEEEHADKMLTPWEMELEMLEDWLNHPEPVDDCHEQTVMQMLAEEHSEESLRNFSQGAEQMMTAVLRSAAEGESEFQSEEQLEEAGDAPAGELAEEKLSEGEAEKRLSDKTAELNFAAEWQAEATEEENSMGDLVDLPTDKDEEVQPRRLHKESQPLEQLDEVIEGIRRLMSRSAAETASEEEAEQRRTCHSSRATDAAATAKQWSRWTTPENCLGSRWISTAVLGSS